MLKEAENKKQSLGRRIVKRMLLVFATFLFLCGIFVFVVSQSTQFRHWTISLILGIANEFLLAEVNIRDIGFSMSDGVSLRDITIVTGEDTLLKAKEISADIDLAGLIFDERIDIRSIKLDNPHINLVRSTNDSLWNFQKIVAPSDKLDDTTKSNLKINVGLIEIKNGSVLFWDSLSNFKPKGKINFTQMAWDKINLDLRDTKFNLSNMDIATSIANLSAIERYSKMDVKQIKMDVEFGADSVVVKNAHLLTQQVNVIFDAAMRNFNVFEDTNDINKTHFKLNLLAEDLDLSFIDNFAVLPIKLGKLRNTKIVANGSLQAMNLEKVIADIYDSHIELHNVKVGNLTDMEKFAYQGNIINTFILRNDILQFLSDIKALQNIPKIRFAYINNTFASGTLDSVYAKVNMRTQVGSVAGMAAIRFGGKPMKYDVNLETNNLNLAFVNPSLSSNINAKVSVKGTDIAPQKIVASLICKINKSEIDNYTITNGDIDIVYDGHKAANINTLTLSLENTQNSTSIIGANGSIDLTDFNIPKTNLALNLHNINFEKFLHNPNMPSNFSSHIYLTTDGLNPDSISAKLTADISECDFNKRSMLPFVLSVNCHTSTNRDTLSLSARNMFGSNMFDITAGGDFSIDDLSTASQIYLPSISSFISDKVDKIVNRFATTDTLTIVDTTISNNSKTNVQQISQYSPFTLNAKINIKQLDFLKIFLPQISFVSSDISSVINISAAPNALNLSIDSLLLKSLAITIHQEKVPLKNGDKSIPTDTTQQTVTNLVLSNMQAALSLRVEKKDTTASIKTLSSSIQALDNENIGRIQYNNIVIDSSSLMLEYTDLDSVFTLEAKAHIDTIIKAKLHTKIKFSERRVGITTDILELQYLDKKWHNEKPILIGYHRRGLSIRDFELVRSDRERISVFGRINDDTLSNINVKVYNFIVSDLNDLVLKPLGSEPLPISANLDSLNLTINGLMSAPNIDAKINVTNIEYSNQSIGNFNIDAHYENENIVGNAVLKQNNRQVVTLDVRKMPLYIGLDKEREMFINKEMDVSLSIDDFPARTMSTLIPTIDNFSGYIRGDIKVGGILPAQYNYTGSLSLKGVGFRVVPINMKYIATGNISIKTDVVTLENIRIFNTKEDITNGAAAITGNIKLEKFNLKNIDISATAERFQVLSDATGEILPQFYGKLIIKTNAKPIRFYGTLDKPNLFCDITILNADVKLSQLLSKTYIKKETKLKYINKDVMRIEMFAVPDTAKIDSLKQEEQKEKSDFFDALNIDVYAKLQKVSASIDLGALGQAFAKIGHKNASDVLHYKKESYSEATIHNGDLSLLQGSTVHIYKKMNATGDITFPTSKITQPNLDIKAQYSGRINNPNTGTTNYSVFVVVTGNITSPNIDFTYSVNGTMASGDKNQIQADALTLLTTGILKGYNDNDNNTSSLLNESGNLIASQIASKTLTDILLKTSIIQNVSLNFGDDQFSNANISITGSIGNFATWTVGGNIQDISSRYNISIDVPISVNRENLNSLLFQISKETEGNTISLDRSMKNWEVKLKLQGNW